ncbi:hypothetical protein ACFRAQ_34885 [Nocardia sp. NPDC056611]|uniref:hypothetical protein n=1 Tax=Nocardia sp. NPDC056611 TaxID=3345877 RepID=UPI00366BFC63
MESVYMQEYGSLSVCSLTPEQHERTCGYWYTVTCGAMAHTAFRSVEELREWLDSHGLKLVNPLPEERGVHSWGPIEGRYRSAMYMDIAQFMAVDPLLMIPQMSNGRYTLGKITEDEDGVRTVHYLNPNRTTGVFPWDTASLGAISPSYRTNVEGERLVREYIAEVLAAREVLATRPVGHWRITARIVHVQPERFHMRTLVLVTPWFEIYNNPEYGDVADTVEQVEQLVRERYAAFLSEDHEMYVTAFPKASWRDLEVYSGE